MVSLRESPWQLERRRRLLIAAGALVVDSCCSGLRFLLVARRGAPAGAARSQLGRSCPDDRRQRRRCDVDGPLSAAGFVEPFGIAVAPDGVIYVTDGGSHRVRRITLDGRVETLAGGVRGFADGPAAAAQFDTPSAIALDAAGVLYVADTGNHAMRRITPDGMVSTLAGDGTPATPTDPPRDSTARSASPLTAAAGSSSPTPTTIASGRSPATASSRRSPAVRCLARTTAARPTRASIRRAE